MREELSDLLPAVVKLAKSAGVEILGIYDGHFAVEAKEDGSPLTAADRLSHELIAQGLRHLTPDIPMFSEESREIDYAERSTWPLFWLVDPLDGTKEFIKRNGEFTVNIALVEGENAILGVVHTPVKSITHSAAQGCGAYRQRGDAAPQDIHVRVYRDGKPRVVASRSHAGGAVATFNQRLREKVGDIELQSMGSALKLCLVAEGFADVYPRLGPTSEWDTAAAQCVVEIAGGRVVDRYNKRLRYNKPSLLNPWFLACGGGNFDWCQLLDGILE